MTYSDKGFTEVKFHIINGIIFILVIFITPFLGLILSIIQYSPSRSGADQFWINPFITLLPISYFLISLTYLYKRKSLRFISLFIMSIILFEIILVLNGEKEIKQDYITLLNKVGIIKDK